MSAIGKSIAITISMISLVLSLAVVSPTQAIGKENKRTANPAKFQQVQNLKTRNVSASGTGLRSAASGARNPKLGGQPRSTVTMLDYEGSPVVTYSRKGR